MRHLSIGLVLLVLPALACTQRPLKVVSPEGRGLAGVDVHVQSSRGEDWRVAGVTDDSGVVRVPRAGRSVRLVGVGRETRVVGLDDPEARDAIVLRAESLLMPGLSVRSPRAACAATGDSGSSDDADARALWERAAEPHRGDWDTVGLAAYGSFHGGPVDFEDRDLPPPDSGNAWVMALAGSHAIEEKIRQHGYAWQLPPGQRGIWEGQEFGYWYYPRFALLNAYHLTSRLFGELNGFVLLHERAGEAQIAFCTRDQKRPFVMGVLTLRDGEIAHAIWRFSTPHAVQDAGGEATFQHNPNAAILTPKVSMYWTSRGLEDQYLQRRFIVIHEYLLEHQLRERNAQRRPRG